MEKVSKRAQNVISILLMVAVVLAFVGTRAWSQTPDTTLYQQAYIPDDEGSKLNSCGYFWKVPSTASFPAQYCGYVLGESYAQRAWCVALDGANFGTTGQIANAAAANSILMGSGSCTYSGDGSCSPPGIPADAAWVQGQGSLSNYLISINAWPGRYEMSYQVTSANTVWSSSAGGTGRSNGGCFHYTRPSSAMGYIDIVVRLATGAPTSMSNMRFRHPATGGTGDAMGIVAITITGTRRLYLPIGRTVDMAPNSSQWWGLTVPSQPAVNTYYVTVDSGGSVLNVSSNPSNSDANQSGGSYDGPPGESNWWTNMLCEAFCAHESSLSGLYESSQNFAAWGPFGYITAFFGLFATPPETPHDSYYVIRMQGPEGLPGNDFSFDFRDPTTDPPPAVLSYPPHTQGTMYGQLRAYLRALLGYCVWGFGAIGLFRWLRPKQQI